MLIKKCIESVKKYHPDYEIKVLDFDSIKDYVEIPEKYYKLLEEKKIPIAIFSDILCLNLLKQYGGIWIDSTIYLTSKIPDLVFDSDFFAFKIDKNNNNENAMPCYFMRAKRNNKFINTIKDAIDAYWAENDFVINYFMFEHLFSF